MDSEMDITCGKFNIEGGPNSNDYGKNRVLHHTIGLPNLSQEMWCFKPCHLIPEHGDRICGFLFEPIQGEAGLEQHSKKLHRSRKNILANLVNSKYYFVSHMELGYILDIYRSFF